MGMEQKAREGQWVINQAPYGYEIDKENKTLVINEEEAKVVKRIYDLYLSGKSMNYIAREFNRLNIFTKTDTIWNDFKVKYILSNPLYKGTMRYNYRVNKENYFEVEDSHPAIIPADTFENANRMRENRRIVHPKSATSKFIFSGIARCGRCGSPLAGKYGYSKRGNKEYHTQSYYCTRQKVGGCNQRKMSERYIGTQFLNYLDSLQIKPDVSEDVTNQEEQ
ncbi:hypothetical protein JOC86_001193 [Bacillus pakistanensis]|uniref:Recombinase domain-containing protein n=2 Tax=Rossellomorea pakistanensis TaxID=992288 RepID=A0ABS2N9X3_9BACI|nr:hypothetical protein [Bacillus pakistanensis]